MEEEKNNTEEMKDLSDYESGWYSDVGYKIQMWAKICFAICLIGLLSYGIYLIVISAKIVQIPTNSAFYSLSNKNDAFGKIWIGVGCILLATPISYILSLFIYSFGQFISDVHLKARSLEDISDSLKEKGKKE